MYKVMLVDDEKLILNGLKLLIDWQGLGLVIDSVAGNGEEAIELFKKSPVDIIITDITMPKVNGLSLIKEIKKINPDTRYIIFSGYDDFNYAKQAIHLGIENYIIKPVNEEELIETLINTIKKLDAMERMPIIEGKRLELIKENILCRWVQDNISNYELEERNTILDIDLSMEFYCVGIIKLDIDINTNFEDTQNIYKIIKTGIAKFEMGEAFQDLDSNLVCIIGSNSKDQLAHDSQEFYTELIDEVKTRFHINSFASIGSIEKSFRNANNSFNEARQLKKYLLVTGFNRVLNYNDINNNIRTKNEEMIDSSELQRIIMTKDEGLIENYIDELFSSLCTKESISPEDIQNVAVKIIFVFNDFSTELGFCDEELDGSTKELIMNICSIETVEELKQIIKNKGREFLDKFKQDMDVKSPIVKRIIAYVKGNYSEELSLKTLGQKFNVNPSYLGQVFYKEIGEQFSEYLNRIRNEHARELLLNTDQRINEIAKCVGYTDNSYFYKKFKDVYGVSPNTLRSSRNYN